MLSYIFFILFLLLCFFPNFAFAIPANSTASSEDKKSPLGKIFIQFRSDLEKHNNTVDSTLVNEGKRFGFQFNYIRMNWMGDLNEDVSYRFRLRFDKAFDSVANDNTLSSVNYMYLNYKVSSIYKFTIGKQYLFGGGRETLKGAANTHGFSLASLAALYGTGLTLNSKLTKNHSLKFMIINGDDASNQTKLGLGFVYMGKLFNDSFKPMFTAHFLPTSEQTTTSGSKTINEVMTKHFSLTTEIETKLFHFSLGCHYSDYGINSASESAKDKKQSCYLWNEYKLTDKIHPILTGNAGNEYDNGKKIVNEFSIKSGVHYYINGKRNNHIHLIYDYKKIQNIGSSLDTTVNRVILGLTHQFGIPY